MTEDDIRTLLHELRDEPVPADSLARVRMTVTERTRVERRIPWLVWDWKRLAMLAAAIAVAVVAILFRPGHRSIPPTDEALNEAATIPAAPAPVLRSEPRSAPVRVTAKKTRKIPRAKSANGDNLLVRIETADPDVVILLVGGGD